MKKFFFILLASIVLAGCSGAPEWEMIEKVKTSCPGWQVDGQCLPFATTLQTKLKAAGFKAQLVTFGYYVIGESGKVNGATHSVVAYTARGHEVWIQDNITQHPVWVDKSGKLEWEDRLKQFLMTAYSTYDPETHQLVTQVTSYHVTFIQVND